MPVKNKKEIKKDKNCECGDDCACGKSWKGKCGGGCGAVYCLGFIGAAIYYIGHATTFWAGVLGFLKALVWPVFLVMKVLGM